MGGVGVELQTLIERYSGSREDRGKAVFSTIFIVGNKLQTLFDARIPKLTLRQFMLLSIAGQAASPLTLTELGEVLGCSRQNVRKLAGALEAKGFAELRRSEEDARAVTLLPTEKAKAYIAEVFPEYASELGALFSVYDDAEEKALFELMMRLYAGLEKLAEAGEGGKNA